MRKLVWLGGGFELEKEKEGIDVKDFKKGENRIDECKFRNEGKRENLYIRRMVVVWIEIGK